MVHEEIDNEEDFRYTSPIERPYLIRSRASTEAQRKEDIKEVLKTLDFFKFNGRFEINQDFGILLRSNYFLPKKLEIAFRGRLDVMPVEYLNENVSH